MKISGIYKIQSIAKPKRCYVGSTVIVSKRWCDHLRTLRNNKHHSIKLQRHFNKYGELDLIFTILIECEKEDLIKHEQFFIDSLNPYFNSSPTAGNCLGVKHSKKVCKNNSERHKGEKNNRFGKHLTKEHIQILIESNQNRIVSEETKDKLRKANEGKTASQETKDKMSKQRIGKPTPMAGLPAWNKGMVDIYSEETLQKIRDARSKQIFSQESQNKKSETMKKIWALKKLKQIA